MGDYKWAADRIAELERQLAEARSLVERVTRDRDEQWRDKLRERERSVEFVARIKDLGSQVAELELTGDRAELQSLLDACGLDFERMRERALAAERQLVDARREREEIRRARMEECESLRAKLVESMAALEHIVRECGALNKGPVAVAIARAALAAKP